MRKIYQTRAHNIKSHKLQINSKFTNRAQNDITFKMVVRLALITAYVNLFLCIVQFNCIASEAVITFIYITSYIYNLPSLLRSPSSSSTLPHSPASCQLQFTPPSFPSLLPAPVHPSLTPPASCQLQFTQEKTNSRKDKLVYYHLYTHIILYTYIL